MTTRSSVAGWRKKSFFYAMVVSRFVYLIVVSSRSKRNESAEQSDGGGGEWIVLSLIEHVDEKEMKHSKSRKKELYPPPPARNGKNLSLSLSLSSPRAVKSEWKLTWSAGQIRHENGAHCCGRPSAVLTITWASEYLGLANKDVGGRHREEDITRKKVHVLNDTRKMGGNNANVCLWWLAEFDLVFFFLLFFFLLLITLEGSEISLFVCYFFLFNTNLVPEFHGVGREFCSCGWVCVCVCVSEWFWEWVCRWSWFARLNSLGFIRFSRRVWPCGAANRRWRTQWNRQWSWPLTIRAAASCAPRSFQNRDSDPSGSVWATTQTKTTFFEGDEEWKRSIWNCHFFIHSYWKKTPSM